MEPGGVEAFIDRSRDRLVGALFLYVGDVGAAEDLAQEAFARAWERWATIERPEAWVYRVAFDLARSRGRRRGRERRANAFVAARPVAVVADATEGVAAVRAAVASLPDRQREAIVLRFYLDLPVAEIAAVMGCADGTVKATLHHAIAALRLLGPDLAEVSDG